MSKINFTSIYIPKFQELFPSPFTMYNYNNLIQENNNFLFDNNNINQQTFLVDYFNNITKLYGKNIILKGLNILSSSLYYNPSDNNQPYLRVLLSDGYIIVDNYFLSITFSPDHYFLFKYPQNDQNLQNDLIAIIYSYFDKSSKVFEIRHAYVNTKKANDLYSPTDLNSSIPLSFDIEKNKLIFFAASVKYFPEQLQLIKLTPNNYIFRNRYTCISHITNNYNFDYDSIIPPFSNDCGEF